MTVARSMLAAAGLLAALAARGEEDLTLSAAETLAQDRDPGLQALAARRDALLETSVAAGALPDPVLKLGAVALPTDSFDLDQEPMTQLQVGVRQRFPPGRSRSLASRQAREQAAGIAAQREAARRRLRLELRQAWFEQVAHRRVLAELEAAAGVLSELRALAEDYYATGRARQQDVHEAELEAARLEARLLTARQAADAGAARLSTWLGEAAYGPLSTQWPPLPSPREPAVVDAHPLLAAAARSVNAADTATALAEQQYRPGFSLELAYGARQAEGLTGAELPDLVSAMVEMELPLFPDRRQDRRLAAARLEAEAARQQQADLRRRLAAALAGARAELARLEQRCRLYEERLLPEAEENRAVALDAYRAAVGDLRDLLRARLAEYDIRVEAERARAERGAAAAQVLYLTGESP